MTTAGYLANYMARLYLNALRTRIAPLGIVPGQFPVLMALWESDGLTQKELLAMLDIEQATLTSTLSRMERDQLVGRKTHASDARARTVHLTDRGRSLCTVAAEAAERLDADMFADLSAKERKRFLVYMCKVSAKMKGPENSGRPQQRQKADAKN